MHQYIVFGWGLQVFCMERSSACPSRIGFSILWSSSIGFTVVKNSLPVPFLELLPPGINPLLIIECISLTFPMWLMYSVGSSGNSTLSCNAGSTKLSPESPWIALKYKKCFEELGFKTKLKPFLWSSSLCTKRYPIVKCPSRSTT